jgi:hypothetical protein
MEYEDGGIQLAEYVPASDEVEGIQLVSDQQWSGQNRSGIEAAGYCTVSDSCATGRYAAGHCWSGHGWSGHGWSGHGRHGRWCFRGGRWGWWPCHYCPLHRKWCFDDGDECDDDDDCFCHFCCLKHWLFADEFCPMEMEMEMAAGGARFLRSATTTWRIP